MPRDDAPQSGDTGIAEGLKLVQVVYFQGFEGSSTRLIEPVFEGVCDRLAVGSTLDRTDLESLADRTGESI